MTLADKSIKSVEIKSTVVPEDVEEEEEVEELEHENLTRIESCQKLKEMESDLRNNILVESKEQNMSIANSSGSGNKNIEQSVESTNENLSHGDKIEELTYIPSKKAREQKRRPRQSDIVANVVNHKAVAHKPKMFVRSDDAMDSAKRGDDFDKINDKEEYDL